MRRRVCLTIVSAVLLVGAACANSNGANNTDAVSTPLEDSTRDDLDALFGSLESAPDITALERLAGVGDPRLGWLFTDLLRFIAPTTPFGQAAVDVAALGPLGQIGHPHQRVQRFAADLARQLHGVGAAR